MYEAGNTARIVPFEDRRMWRLLLARLHPDAGGDHELFAFACAVRDEVSKHLMEDTDSDEKGRNTEGAALFLRSWQEAMGRWSSSNRDALNNFRTR